MVLEFLALSAAASFVFKGGAMLLGAGQHSAYKANKKQQEANEKQEEANEKVMTRKVRVINLESGAEDACSVNDVVKFSDPESDGDWDVDLVVLRERRR